jgi:hypothetical protein
MKKRIKQVAAWARLLGHCHTLGDSFKPSHDSVNRTAMEHILTESQKAIEAVHKAESVLATAIVSRDEAFARLPLVGTRIVSALKAMDTPASHVSNINRVRQRLRGSTPSEKEVTAQTTSPGGQAGQNSIGSGPSSAHEPRKRTYGDIISRINTFQVMVQRIGDLPFYAPNEDDLTLENLKRYLAELVQKHETVMVVKQDVKVAYDQLDALLFGDGMHKKSKMVKDYVRSAFGHNSQEFKEIRKIKFFNK